MRITGRFDLTSSSAPCDDRAKICHQVQLDPLLVANNILYFDDLFSSQDLAQGTSALAQQTLCHTTLCCGLPMPKRMLKAALASTHWTSVTSFHPAAVNKLHEATAKFPTLPCHLKSAGLASGHLHKHHKYLSKANSQGFLVELDQFLR